MDQNERIAIDAAVKAKQLQQKQQAGGMPKSHAVSPASRWIAIAIWAIAALMLVLMALGF